MLLLPFTDPQPPLPLFLAWSLAAHMSICTLVTWCWAHLPSSSPLCPLACLHLCVSVLAVPVVTSLPVHPSLFVSPGSMEEETSYFPQD